MPYAPSDAGAHVKGLTPHQKAVWAAVANSALNRCKADGGTDETCAGKALAQAAGVAKRSKEPKAGGETLAAISDEDFLAAVERALLKDDADPRSFAATKTEGGADFPAAAYAYVPDPEQPSTWKLRLWETPDGGPTARQVGMAVAALGAGGFRGQKVQIPAADLAAVTAKVRAAWRKVNPDAAPADMPAAIKGAEDPSASTWDSMRHFLRKLGELLRGKVAAADFDEAVRTARSSTGGTARARARSAFAEPSDSLWVGYWLTPQEAAGIAVDGGEAAADLHLTLAWLGAMGDLPADAAERARAAVAAFAYGADPIEADLAGIGVFDASEGSDWQEVYYAAVESDELLDFRGELCEALARVGLPPRGMGALDYTPHITLRYVPAGTDPGAMPVPRGTLTLDAVTLAVGGARTAFPLRGADAGDGMDLGMGGGMMAGAEDALAFADGGADLVSLAAAPSGRYRLFVDQRRAGDAAAAADAPAEVTVLPRPGTYRHPRWGDIRLTAERIARFVGNFNAGVYQSQVAIDAEHELKVSGALGWLKAGTMRVAEDGTAVAPVEWTDRGLAMVEGKRFRYVSPEWYDAWTAPDTGREYRDVLIGAALTNRPFYKEPSLPPLVAASDGDLYPYLPQGIAGTIPVFRFAEAADPAPADGGADPAGGVPGDDDEPDPDPGAVEDREGGMPEPNSNPGAAGGAGGDAGAVTAAQFSEMQATLARQAAELEALRSTSETQAEALRAATETANRLASERDARRFTDMALGRGGEGDGGPRWFGEPERHVTMLTELARAFGEDSEQFRAYVENQRSAAVAIAEARRQAGIFGERGSAQSGAGASAEDRVNAAVEALMASEHIPYDAAFDRLMASDRALAREFSEERSRRRASRATEEN